MIRPDTGPGDVRGYTMLEIMIALTVLALLVFVMGPRMVELSSRMEANGAARQVLGDLERARTEAIERNTTVSVEKTGASTYSIQYVGVRSLDGAVFTSAPDSIVFAAFGLSTMGGATYVVRAGNHAESVVLDAAGHARIR